MRYLFTFDLRRGAMHVQDIINHIATEEAEELNLPQEEIANLIQRVNNRIALEYGEVELERNYREIERIFNHLADQNDFILYPISLNTSYLIESNHHNYDQIYQIIIEGLIQPRIIYPSDDYIFTILPENNHIIHNADNQA